jgi:hypothetical protein
MESDALWQAFAETGDPLYYMLYKQTQQGRTETNGGGEEPRAEG